MGALATTTQANGFFTLSAIRRALVAKVVLAERTEVGIFRGYRVSTVIARCSVPVLERNVRAIRVVGIEDAPYHREEIAQPALFQGRRYRYSAITLAEPLAAYMWMSHIVVSACRVWIQGNYTVGTISVELSEPAKIQSNLERS